MENILEILKSANVELTEDQKKTVTEAVKKSYRGIEEFEDKKNRILELKKLNDDLSEKIKNFDGDKSKLEDLQKKLADFEAAEVKRKEEQQAAELEKTIRERFAPLKGDNEFYNSYAEKETYEEFKKAVSDKTNAGRSDSDIYAAIIKDKDVYKPKEKFINPPVGGESSSKTDEIAKARSVMGLKN